MKEETRKRYVLDTNVLLNDPEAMFKFDEHEVVIPITCIEELDKFKKDQNELGRNARQVARNLDGLREIGHLHEGVPLPNGGHLKVMLVLLRILDRLPYDLNDNLADNRILAVALDCKGTLVSKDINLRIKADALGIPSEDYQHTKINVDTLYTGVDKIYASDVAIDAIYQNGFSPLEFAGLEKEPLPHECFVAHSIANEKHSALLKYNHIYKRFDLLPNDLKTLGLDPRNSEQKFAMDMLLNPAINLVSLIGLAGSGKTLLALAAGLHGVMETGLYKKLLLLKPVAPMDGAHELGFMPGNMMEKLAPWMASYYDNIEFIMGYKEDEPKPEIAKTKGGKKLKKPDYDCPNDWDEKKVGKVSPAEELISLNFLEIGSLEHIRGRSLPNQFIILDEAQNMSQNSIKTVITRAGEGTKIVLLGDISQIDVPYLDASSNGLTYVADKFKGQDISAHLTLMKSERSRLAQLAADLL